uniref:Plastocyanin-like domain-containing protein n=1 Tax=Leersia perrieri TaxID=77586 RepID=A0A0D9UWB5_9ORYZ
MGPRIQQLAAVLLAAAVVVAAARDEPRKNYGFDHSLDAVMSILNCKTTFDLQKYVDALPQMAKIQGYAIWHGRPRSIQLTIGMYQKTWKFHRDMPPTPVFMYGQSRETATFPGPTIVARHNVPLYVKWKNHLPDTHILPWDPKVDTAIPKHGGVPTVVHLHSGAHPPEYDGSAFAWFTRDFRDRGPAWTRTTYRYPNVQAPGNLWYHDHALGLTRVSLLAGLLAAYVIEKPEIETPMNLPRGAHDLFLVIADRKFYTNGSIYIEKEWQPEYFGEIITVNGKAWPFLAVHRRRYRLRILNASNARYFNITLSNGLPFHVIGSDSSYLSKPVTVTNLVLSPAEIFDVIVDFSLSSTTGIEMLNSARYPFPNGDAVPDPKLDGTVMKFVIKRKRKLDDDILDNSEVPEHGVSYASLTSVPPPVVMRKITMYEYFAPNNATKTTGLYINGLQLRDPVTETPKSGTTELWQVINLTGDNHPLHIHLGTLQAVKMQELSNVQTFTSCMVKLNDTVKCNFDQHANGITVPVPEEEKTWKNVVKIPPGTVTTVKVAFLLVESNRPYPFDATTEPGFVYHCHILDHEDNAMIRPLKLLR